VTAVTELSPTTAEPGKIPASLGTPLNYGLKSLLNEWWPRRHLINRLGANNMMWENVYTYTPSSNRPAVDQKLKMPGAFASDEGDNKGVPPFGWVHDEGSPMDNLPKGMHFFDPAFVYKDRFGLTDTDVSTDYCFNPYLAIDIRGTDENCPAHAD
jgi:hypothetical protein